MPIVSSKAAPSLSWVMGHRGRKPPRSLRRAMSIPLFPIVKGGASRALLRDWDQRVTLFLVADHGDKAVTNGRHVPDDCIRFHVHAMEGHAAGLELDPLRGQLRDAFLDVGHGPSVGVGDPAPGARQEGHVRANKGDDEMGRHLLGQELAAGQGDQFDQMFDCDRPAGAYQKNRLGLTESGESGCVCEFRRQGRRWEGEGRDEEAAYYLFHGHVVLLELMGLSR